MVQPAIERTSAVTTLLKFVHLAAIALWSGELIALPFLFWQRRMLEEAATRLALPQSRVPPADVFIGALLRAELRTAYLVSGDLLAAIDEVRNDDAALHEATLRPGQRSLAALLEHPLAGDLCRFALTAEATALRRRIGSVWT